MSTDGHGGGYSVSLIIPIFNVEQYLEECLLSVEHQSIFNETQVILVDDGSTDNSVQIARNFAEQHSNVSLIECENAGAGAARNSGLAIATAPFVAFLDSDDCLPPKSLELRVRAMKPDIDVVVGDMKTFPRKTIWPWTKGVQKSARTIAGVASFPELLSNASPCNKLFRISDFKDKPFPSGVHFEDAFVVIPILLEAAAIAIIPDTVYQYRKRESADSIMDGLFTRPQNYWDHLAVAKSVLEQSKRYSLPRRRVSEKFAVRSMQGFLLRAAQVFDSEELVRYFDAAVDVFGEFDPTLIASATLDLAHRLPFLAILTKNQPLFVSPWEQSLPLFVIDGEDHVRIDGNSGEQLRSLTRVKKPATLLEYVERGDEPGTIFLQGRVTLPGVPAGGLQDLIRVKIATNGREISTGSRTRLRQAAADEARVTILEWSCTVPLSALTTGEFVLDARVYASNGFFVMRLRPTVGFLRSTRGIHVRGGFMKILPREDSRVALRVQRQVRRLTRVLWHLRGLEEDLRELRDRAPFASWRLLRNLTKFIYLGRPIWLLSERGDTAQDNGYALFDWLRQSSRKVRVRYILDRNSSVWDELASHRGVIRRSGWRHRLLLLHAKVLISSHDIDAYMLPVHWDKNAYRHHLSPRLEHRRVFLQHGVTDKGVGRQLARGVTGLDLLICSIEAEREYLEGATAYSRQLAVTGMPRLDGLLNRRRSRRILIAPTWRKYLVAPSYSGRTTDPGTFVGSRYERFYVELLGSPRLAEIARRNDVVVTFLPHSEVVDHFRKALDDAKAVDIVSEPGRGFQEYILSSRVFVSDFSSTMFDAAYAGIPVVQLTFDQDEFFSKHYAPGWFAPVADQYWKNADSVDNALDAIEDMISGTDKEASARLDSAQRLFTYRDDKNCSRVYEAILSIDR